MNSQESSSRIIIADNKLMNKSTRILNIVEYQRFISNNAETAASGLFALMGGRRWKVGRRSEDDRASD